MSAAEPAAIQVHPPPTCQNYARIAMIILRTATFNRCTKHQRKNLPNRRGGLRDGATKPILVRMFHFKKLPRKYRCQILFSLIRSKNFSRSKVKYGQNLHQKSRNNWSRRFLHSILVETRISCFQHQFLYLTQKIGIPFSL